jgi:hypothetical protein
MIPTEPIPPPPIPKTTNKIEPSEFEQEVQPEIEPSNQIERGTIKCQNSSMVHSFEYNKSDKTLRVYFRGGQIYDYFFIPQEIADEFKRVCEEPGESAGKWFAKTIRKTYEYQKVA